MGLWLLAVIFMEIIKGVIITVIGAAVIGWLGIGGSKTVVTVGSTRVTKKWKALIVIGWVMLIGGSLYCLSWASVSGFNNPKTGLGLSLAFSGLLILLIGRFGEWWNRH